MDPARRGALRLLAGVRDGGSIGDQIATGALTALAAPDRARAQRLALETLRHLGRADVALAPHLQRRPRPAVMDILRLATVEMLQLAEAPHGVVSGAVDATRAQGPKGRAAAGMVNAVLRKVAATENWAAIPAQQMPTWLRKPLIAAYGKAVVRDIEAAHQADAPLDLSAKSDARAVAEKTGGMLLPTGSVRLASAQVTGIAGYASGDWWVQDAAAALAVKLLDPKPGEFIADLCAAPGGKTMQLAAAGARVAALDLSPSRLTRVRENLTRTGLSADLIAGDALDWRPEVAPDAILLDAPCSATGTIRRHPDLAFIRDGAGLDDIRALQARLIDHALAILRPGGRLVFATCSLLPAEGEDQLAAALQRYPDISVTRPDLPGTDPGWITAQGGLRLRPDYWPGTGGMDGFFIARLCKPAA